jgi:hypothetical protein
MHLPRLVFATALVCASALILPAREKWLYARAEHFEMFSTAPEKTSRRVLAELEQFRAGFLAMFPLPRERDPRATVVLFDTERQFRPYKPLYKGKPREDVSGYFVSGADEVVIALTTEAGDEEEAADPTESIFHEYVHLLLHSRGVSPPLWLNEGLAEVYSTFDLKPDSVEFGRAKSYASVLNLVPLMPLRRLFAVTAASREYNEDERAGIFYAESWALLHYLICGTNRDNQPKLIHFIHLLEAGNTNQEDSFRQAFGMSYAEMETALRSYLDNGQFYLRRAPLPLPDLAAKLQFRPATDFERDLALLNLLWRVQQPGDTAARAIEFAEKQPASPRPYEILAHVAITDGDTAKAMHYWKRAAELKSDNAYVYVQLASAAIREFTTVIDLDYRIPGRHAADLRYWLETAIKLSPDYLEAYHGLATVEAFAPGVRIPAVNRVQSVVREMSDPSHTLLDLAIARWRLGDAVTSGEIIESLIRSPQTPPEIKAGARILRLHLSSPTAPLAPISPTK